MFFDKVWFIKFQKILLWLLNTPIVSLWFRYILRINGGRSDVGKNKIIKVIPNAVFWGGKIKGYKFVKGQKVYEQEFVAEFRTHDKFSKRLKYAFYPIWMIAHIWDTIFANNLSPELNLGFDTLTQYSNTGGDGAIPLTSNTWSTVHDAVDGASCDNTLTSGKLFQCAFITPTYYFNRGFFPFDTSALDDAATISAGVFSVVNNDRHNTSETVDIVQSTQASNTNLVLGDYDQLGTTVGGNKVLSTFSNDDTTYDGITLNATGLTWISKTGYTKLAARGHNDTTNTAATTWEDIVCYYSDNAGTTKDPKLVVTFTVGTTYTETYTDVIVIAEVINKSEIRVITDVVTLVDSATKEVIKVISDVITIADSISKQTIKVLTDAITIIDGVIFSIGKVISDTIVISESIIKSIQKILTDTISITEIIEKILNVIGNIPKYIRAMASPKPTGFSNDKDKPGIGVARAVDKPERV